MSAGEPGSGVPVEAGEARGRVHPDVRSDVAKIAVMSRYSRAFRRINSGRFRPVRYFAVITGYFIHGSDEKIAEGEIRTMDRQQIYPVFLAVGGAALFGASAPLAKALLGSVDPIVLAALLYLGCGAGLLLTKIVGRLRTVKREAGLSKADLPWLAVSAIAGGVIAPILLMLGLQSTPAATASLLLNFECVATTTIAVLAFREAVGRRVWVAIGLITMAAAVLTLDLSGAFGISAGALAVVGACIFWGIDNNVTCRISAKDPVTIGLFKGLAAGTFSLVLATTLSRPMPAGITPVIIVLIVGALSYGLSIVMFILASRGMGAARTSAWFGIAPFAGTALSLALFTDAPGLQLLLSLPLMIAGAALLFGEHHDHIHVHTAVYHEHYYEPDVHHPFKTAGTGRHYHEETRHTHAHRPDIHHRHGHEEEKKE